MEVFSFCSHFTQFFKLFVSYVLKIIYFAHYILKLCIIYNYMTVTNHSSILLKTKLWKLTDLQKGFAT